VELLQFRAREFGDGGLDFLNCTHGGKIAKGQCFAKPVFLIDRLGDTSLAVEVAPRLG
jgi:hypothetical protein